MTISEIIELETTSVTHLECGECPDCPCEPDDCPCEYADCPDWHKDVCGRDR